MEPKKKTAYEEDLFEKIEALETLLKKKTMKKQKIGVNEKRKIQKPNQKRNLTRRQKNTKRVERHGEQTRRKYSKKQKKNTKKEYSKKIEEMEERYIYTFRNMKLMSNTQKMCQIECQIRNVQTNTFW